MENIEKNEVTEQEHEVATEQVTEPKYEFTKDDVDSIVGKRLARQETKLRKEYEQKYGALEEVLRAGTGKENVEDITSTFRDFYAKKGIQVAQKPTYSDREIEILAKANAQDIIESGYDEVKAEVDRLMKKGAANMTPQEKAEFRHLAEYRQSAERNLELSKMGVPKDVYESAEFKEFASKFNSTTPAKDIYDIYNRAIPKKEYKPMGSMKTSTMEDKGVKDFYTRDEAMKFSRKELDANPELYKAIVNSMLKW